MTSLKYLAAIIPTTFVAYGLVVGILLYFYNRQEKKIIGETAENSNVNNLLVSYFRVLPFENTYQSINPYGGRLLLFCTRLASFGYICGLSGLWNFIRNDWDNLFYFTHWNVIMISVFYGCALACSVIGFIYNEDFRAGKTSGGSWVTVEATRISNQQREEAYWSVYAQRLGFCMQILFEVAGGTALFVTVVAFTFLNPSFEFWNVSDHFVTSMTFLAEMAQNSMIVRWHHVLLNMLWALLYLIYIWPAVASGDVTNWPYSFLSVSSAGCFGWYFMLFFGNAIFYSIFYFFSRFKYEIIYRNSPSALWVLVDHYRGTGRRVEASSLSSSSEADVRVPTGARGIFSGDSTQEVLQGQDSPMTRGGGAFSGIETRYP